ncbi:MAG: plasmid maintenance protein [Desulfobulbaceae bacterium S3730MH12]|nr:MAG: plasmid maintenance protein [Desulfobulbaceae bacterium S3730MH12]OEU81686.1 MAG: plasmid maintenance protein [Desulfobulbaceae bacterium C00003063]
MRYMLDTDICSYVIRERPLEVFEQFKKVDVNQLCISTVTYAELIYGVEHSSSRKINRPIIDDFVRHLDIITWDEEAAEHYGKIRAFLRAEGNIIGSMDMMIAAHARSRNMTLITNNDKHFKRVPNLRIENWVAK